MIADWSVEAGAQSAVITVPWEHWTDLRKITADSTTRLTECITELRDYPELAALLLLANSGDTFTSKVDVFPVTREDADPEIGEAGMDATAHGLGSYLDLLTPQLDTFNAFSVYEQAARTAVRSLQKTHSEMCAVEIVLRPARLYKRDTFGWTIYVLGFGPDLAQARGRWAQAFHTGLAALLQSIAARIH